MAINLVISQVVGQAFVVKPDGELVQAAPNTVLQTGDVLSVPNGKNAWLVTEEGEQLDVLDEALLVGEEDFDNLDLPSDVLDVIAAIEEGDDPTQKEGTETAAGEEAAGSALTAASIIEYIGSTGGISNITAFDSTGLFGSNKLTSGQTETLFSSRYLPIQQKPGSDDEGAGGNTNAPPTFGNFTISSQEDGDIILSREDILGAIRGGNAANIQVTDIRPSVEGATITKNSDGSFTLTPPPNFSGTINFTIDITDGQYKTSGTVGVTVAEVEDTPEISITPVELTEDENVAEGSVVASIDATDGDGDALTIEITNDPDGYFKVENGNVVLTEAGAAAIDDDTLNLDEISVTVSVSDGKTTVEETVTLPISRTDDDAKVEGDTTATVTDGNGTVPPSATGTLTVVDPDSNNETALENGTYKGEYGSLEVNNGVWVYTADKEALAPLGEGEQATDIVTITASDGSTHQIVLNIEGTNDPALVSGDISATVSGEGGNLQASGTLTSNDVDGENNTFIAETITTLRGELTINEDGSWSYVSTDPTGAIEALGEGDTLTEYVTVKAADGTEQQIVITFQGVNDDAVFSAISTGEITESDGAMSAQGTININDPDAGESFMQAGTFDGTWGSVTIDAAGNWTYTTHDSSDSAIKSLADGEKMTDTITVYSVDGTETQITITINGTNDEAVIGGDITATVVDNSGTMTATGTLTSADVDGTDNKFVAETISTLRGEITIDEDGNWTYTTTDPTGAIERLPEGETLTEVVIVRSEDGTEQQIVLTLVGTNNAPEFSAISSRDVYEANDVISVSGTINVVDSDLGESFMEAGTYVGDLGAVTIDRAGNWTYTTDPGQNAALDSLKEGEQRIETITVRSEDGTETDIKVTIIGTNDPALIAGDIVGTVVEADGTMSTSGQLTATDVDGNDNTFTPQTLEGRWGELTIDANGNWTYSSDDDKGAINRLGLGEQLTDTLTVQSEDGTEQTITITITGTNDAAVFGGMNSVSIDETDSQLTTSGRLTVSDADYGESFFEAGTFNGTYGEVSIDEAGNWTYTSDPAYNATFDALEEGEQLVDTITVRSQDGTETQILVTVVGTNDPAEIAGDIVGTLVESDGTMSTSGQLTSTDVDGNDNAFTPQTIEGRWGEITIDANGNWTYSSTDEKGAINRLGEGDQLTDTISVRAEDGTVQTITITIDGTNDTAVFGGMTNVTVTETDSAITTNGRATVSDADYGESFFQAGTFTGTYGEINIDKAGNWTYTSSPEHTASFDALDAGDVLPESITVYALDGTPLTIEINIQGTDDLPVVSGQTGGALTDTTTGEAQFVTGSLSISDVDADDSPTFEDTRIEGEFGVLEMVDGEWTYTLDKDAASRLNSGETDTDIITVTASDGTEQKIVITVTGTDDEPVLTGNTVGSISDNGSPTTSGFISVIDPDSDNSPTLPDAEVDGQYGSLTLIDGEWTYTLNPDSVAALPDGETTIDVVTLEASDGSKHEITITITGTDQEPVLTGNTTGVITEGSAALTATGSVSLVDVDTGENPTLPNGTTDGQYGSLTLVDGAWTYTLDPDLAQYLDEGESTTDTITITASDGSVHDIVITITGSEDSAMLEGDISGSVSDDSASLTASGSLSVSDPDTSDNPTLPDTNQQGQYGSFTMVDGNWTYTLDPELAAVLDEGVTVTDTIIITDSMGGTHELAINVTGTDNAAELTGDTSANLVEGTDLTATGSVSVIDADSGDNPVIANTDVEGQYGSFSLVDGEWTYTLDPSVAQGLNAGQTATDTITLVDSENNEHQIVITVEGTADAAVVSGEFTGSVSTETGPVVEITNLFVFGDDADGEPANFSLDSQPDSLSFSSVGFSANITDSDGRLNNDGSQYIELNGQSYPVSANATVQYSDAYGNVFTMAVLTVSATETGEYFGGTSQPTTLLVQIDGPDIVPGTDLALVEGSYQEVSNINYLDVSDAITASGQISISDADTNDTPEFANTTLEGNYGTLELVDGNWTYTLDPSKSEVLGANEVATETFTLTASDDTQQQIKIEVTGTDDAAIVTGNITGSVTDQDTSTSGSINITDPDSGQSATIDNVTIEGEYGTFELIDGNWTYIVDPDKAKPLPEGEEATDTFTLTASDGSTHEIVVTVTGTDDAAVVTGDTTGQVTDQDTSTSGSITVTDPDSGETATIDNVTIQGEYGTFELVDGEWTYTVDPDKAKPLPEGEEATDTFTLTAIDGSTHEIVVTVTGTDDAAVVTGDTTATISDVDTSATGSITVTDPDSGETATIGNTTIEGNYGTFELVDGNWTYTVDPDKAQSLAEGQEANETFTLTASDNSMHEIVVTVTGTNQSAVVTGDTTATISDVDASATGSITVTDPDSGETATIGNTTIEGNYGTFELVDGNWTYTVDPDKAQSLPEGEEANETFTLTASDNSTHEIVVTVTGTNQSAVVTGDTTATISDVDASATGSITVTDPDSGETATIGNTTIEGNYGTFELVDGNWTYTVDPDKAQSLPEGEEANETFTLTASDNSTHEIVVTVTGTNQSAVVTGDTTAAISDVDTSATGSITVTDPDSGETATIGNTTIDGNYGTFELVDGNWTYTVDPDKAQSLPEGQEANETFTLTASDNSTHEIVVTVTGTNQSAVVTGDTTAAISDVDTSATGSITVTDPDSGETATIGNTTIEGNYGTFELVDGNWTYTVDPDKAQSLPEGEEANETFTLTASDNSTHEIVVTVTGTNQSAVVTGDTTAAINDVDTSATGSITVTDPDSGETASIGNTTIEGNYGTFELVDGNWTYTVDPDKAQALPDGEEATETFTLTASDNSTHEIVVTVTGTNQSAVVTGDTTAAISDVDTSATGSITVTDPDSGETATIGNTTIEGNYGTFELVDGNWTYTVDPDKAQALPEGEEATETFTLTASDNSTHEIVVTVEGTNQSAVVTGDTTATISDVDASATGSITVTDPDSGETATIGNTTIEGNYGTFELVDGNWTYTVDPDKAQSLPEGEEANETFTLTASDNSTHEIVVTVEGTNQSAVVTGDTTASITDVDTSATGSITVTDPDSGETATIGNTTIEGNYGTFELVDGNWTYTVDPDKAQALPEGEEANETFTLTASDNSVHEIVVTVTGTNQSAVVTGNTTASITDVDTSATGSITVTDPDSGETASIDNTTIEGNYGTFELVDGNWTYTVDPDKAQTLPEGQEATETFTLTASDNSQHEITVTVEGTDQAAVVTGDTTTSLSDTDTSVSGSITVTDPDSGETASISNTDIDGEYGTFSLVDGEWTYTVDPDKAEAISLGDTETETFTLTASDGSTHQITVDVVGTDQAAVVTGTTTGTISTADLSSAIVGNAFIMDENFSIESGEFHTSNLPPSINFSSGGVSVEFTDNDARLDGDNTHNEYSNDSSQTIELNGVTYPANLDYTLQYTDAQGNVYTMAIVDVDTNADGNNYNAIPDNGKVLIQLDGPEITPDTTLTLVPGSYNNIDGLDYDDIAAPVTVSGTIEISDVDSNDSPSFANTTVEGQYGSLTLEDGEWTYTVDRDKVESLGSDDNVQDVITLTASDGTTQNITINVSGTDDGSIIAGDVTGSITEDVGAQSVSGTITITDPDSGQTPTIPDATLDGAYGTLELVGGEWTYTVNTDAVQSLAQDQVVTDNITVTASDGNQQVISITLTGTNDAAVVTGDTTGNVTDADASTSGTITVTDPDSGETATIGNTTIEGNYGTFELVDGNWTYTVDPDKAQPLTDGETAQDTFTLTASDGSTHDVTVTVTGTDNAGVVTGTTSGSVDAAGFTLNVEESGNLTAGQVTQGDSNGGWNTTTTSIDGVPYVISTSFGYDGTTIISRVENDGSLTETDRITYDSSTGVVTSSVSGDITSAVENAGFSVGGLGNGLTQSNVSNIDGQPTLFLTSQNSGSISAWEISGNGQLTVNGGLTFGNSQTGIVRENVTFETDDGETLIFATRPQGDTVDVLSYNPETGEIA
ncbi:VCBS domain-containing protein, partial [Grimontia indica]|uniref:VCBS domain-containing protein n=1 Tax=Grimontia indica TaxID=1056512 RepID=UPI000587EBE9